MSKDDLPVSFIGLRDVDSVFLSEEQALNQIDDLVAQINTILDKAGEVGNLTQAQIDECEILGERAVRLFEMYCPVPELVDQLRKDLPTFSLNKKIN